MTKATNQVNVISKKTRQRVGIYSGTFDPIHTGHVAFALQAAKLAKLDLVVLMPERRPRKKPEVEHFGHRTAMITRAIKPHSKLALLELPDVHFSVSKTLPKINQKFPNAQLTVLMGSDVAQTLKNWPDIEKLLEDTEIVVGLRNGKTERVIRKELKDIDPSSKIKYIDSHQPRASSAKIRKALRSDSKSRGLLTSVKRYARSNWLYISFEKNN